MPYDTIEVPLDGSFIPYYWGVLPGEGRFAPTEEEFEGAVWRLVVPDRKAPPAPTVEK